MFRQGFSCPVLLFVTHEPRYFEYGAFTLYGRPFQSRFSITLPDSVTGLFRVRSPLLTESRLISFPPGT
jgi:hypothetical protein